MCCKQVSRSSGREQGCKQVRVLGSCNVGNEIDKCCKDIEPKRVRKPFIARVFWAVMGARAYLRILMMRMHVRIRSIVWALSVGSGGQRLCMYTQAWRRHIKFNRAGLRFAIGVASALANNLCEGKATARLDNQVLTFRSTYIKQCVQYLGWTCCWVRWVSWSGMFSQSRVCQLQIMQLKGPADSLSGLPRNLQPCLSISPRT